ncbi:MAG: DUF3788 domain-containing protein [Chloroflexi bacterium]|nr:DUF3788 domain-containing protein [Chloroflexota bacterium]
MSGERWLDKTRLPREEEFLQGLGEQAPAWNSLREVLCASYGLEGDLAWGGNKYGWLMHYRAGGRTLCDLYPEHGSLTALVILGGEERIRMMAIFNQFSPAMQKLIDATPIYHDGTWLWIHIPEAAVDDVLMLLAIKRRPSKRKEALHGVP